MRKISKLLVSLFLVFGTITFIIPVVNSTAYAVSKKNVLKNTGFSMESMSIYNGIFAKNRDNDNVFYGTTIMGSNSTNLFMYNINKNKITKTINIPGVCGSNIMLNYDGNIFVGTYSRATIYKYNIKSETLKKLFELPGEEVSICDFKIYDNRIYIGTYPNSVVYMFDLVTGKLVNLGSMFKLNYVNAIEYNNGKIYAGIGPKVHLIEYDINKKTKHEIELPSSVSNDTFVYTLKIINNKLFIGSTPSNKVLSYDLTTKNFKEELYRVGNNRDEAPDFSQGNTYFTGMSGNIFEYNSANDTLSTLRHNTGAKVSEIIDNSYIASVSSEGVYTEMDFKGDVQKKIDLIDVGFHGPKALPMFSYGSNGYLYFGGKRMAIYDTKNMNTIYKIVPGEPKAITVMDNNLYTANYTDAKLWKYDVGQAFDKEINYSDEGYMLLNIEGQNRPLVMLPLPNKSQLIIATDPYYGLYGSAISIYNTESKSIETIKNIVGRQSIKCMVLDKDNPNYVYIGTTNRGTYGNNPLNENAHIIKYDIASRKKIFDIIPDKKNGIIRSIAYENGVLYFITENEYNLYSINVNNFKIIKMLHKSHMKEILGSADGNLYGISEKALWSIDKKSLMEKQISENLNYLTNIFEDPVQNKIYFFNNTSLYSYE